MRAEAHEFEAVVLGFAIDQDQIRAGVAVSMIVLFAR
jgi:hypothetical protein